MQMLYKLLSSSLKGAGVKPEALNSKGDIARAKKPFKTLLEMEITVSGPERSPNVEAGAGPAPGRVFGAEGMDPSRIKSIPEQIRIYREDQLLSHPGGDDMDLSAPDPRTAPVDREGFLGRIAKDLKDAAENLKNFFKDLFFGSTYRYVDGRGRVKEAGRKGLLGTVAESVKDLAAGLSLGFIRGKDEAGPRGLEERLSYAFRKIAGEALKDDIVFGVPGVLLNLADDAALFAWNLAETAPDMTLGNSPRGEEFVSDVFDNGQVLIDFVTDCLPGGEAWMRVHAYRLGTGKNGVVPPVLFNLGLPVHYAEDESWATIRNTDFRKSIETLGSILPDIGSTLLTQYALRTSKRK